MEIVKPKYDCLVFVGPQAVFEVPDTTTEELLSKYESILNKPVGEREILRFAANGATALVDPNVAGLMIQVISKREFERRQQKSRLANPGPAVGLPNQPGLRK